jgi:hypothetical protein
MSELKTCFKRVDYDLAGLLHYLDIGDIGLPDIQRPFVWPENISISDDPPSKYANELRPRFEAAEWKRMNEMHALPESWETMSYEAFLRARRGLMASVIRRGFETLQ